MLISPFPVDDGSQNRTGAGRVDAIQIENAVWHRPCARQARAWIGAGAPAEIAAGAHVGRHSADRRRLPRLPADSRFLDGPARSPHPLPRQRHRPPRAQKDVGLVGQEEAAQAALARGT